MRPQLPPVPGLVEALPGLVASLDDDLSSRNVMCVAEALWRVGRPQQAIDLLVPLTERDRSAIAPFVLLGWCYEDVGDALRAQATFQMVHDLDPANPFARTEPVPAKPGGAEPPAEPVGVTAEHEAEPEAALTEEELREIPPDPLYSKTLGEIFERQGFEEKAKQIFSRLEEGGDEDAEDRT